MDNILNIAAMTEEKKWYIVPKNSIKILLSGTKWFIVELSKINLGW